MFSDPKDTLAHHRSRVLTRPRDMSDVPCAQVAQAVAHALSNAGTVSPEKEAAEFYLANHVMSEIGARHAPLQPLSPALHDFVIQYHQGSIKRAVRAFHYLVLICIREARHNQSAEVDYLDLREAFGAPCADFIINIAGNSHEEAAKMGFISNPPDCSFGTVCKALHWVFANAHFEQAFGSLPWANVADCLVKFVYGVTSAEIMLDTVFTLAHNCGPIFNKGMFYDHYDGSLLHRVLDLQRAGQLPNALVSDDPITVVLSPYVHNWVIQGFSDAGASVPKAVDWYEVVAAGAVGSYTFELASQEKAVGAPTLDQLKRMKEATAAVGKKVFEEKEAVKKHNLATAQAKIGKLVPEAPHGHFKYGHKQSDVVPLKDRKADAA